ncbi:uncharacterized protein [Mytilus edulis]|uniref:uncharacterized protein n=1 Tax=Mytilus edulis TaxID=6550 RepID=UPI0039EE3DE8
MNFRQVLQVLMLLLGLKVSFGQINITTHGSLSVGSNFSLYCNIPTFTSDSLSASWYRNETWLTDCSNGVCIIKINGNFSFTWNATGISVLISPLQITENNVIWKCVTNSGKEANFTIILPLPSTPSPGDQTSGATRNFSKHQSLTLYVCIIMAMFAIYQYG